MNPKTLLLIFMSLIPLFGKAQTEIYPWGNMRGIRLDGELRAWETAIEADLSDGTSTLRTDHYQVEPDFKRDGDQQTVRTKLGTVAFEETVTEAGSGQADVVLVVEPEVESEIREIRWCIGFESTPDLPELMTLTGHQGSVRLLDLIKTEGDQSSRGTICSIEGLEIREGNRATICNWESPREIRVVAKEKGWEIQIVLWRGGKDAGKEGKETFHLRVEGPADRSPGLIRIDASNPGNIWDGIGGNFRLQFPETDPAVIDYCLETLPVRWSRIALWWTDWEPVEGENPWTKSVSVKELPDNLRSQMALAQRLDRLGIPLIVSVWFPPEWAEDRETQRPGTYGNLLKEEKTEAICRSISDYFSYLKATFGVEAKLFSFNEPDIGVRVVQDPDSHAALGKALGTTLSERGLNTRILLADTSNALSRSLEFAGQALKDPALRGVAGGIGFHTWGGCDSDEGLAAWSNIANQLEIPLFVTESGADSEAHRNPDLFLDERYQLDEAVLYIRLCNLAQPRSLMVWQLTADYSLLDGGDTYGRPGPLTPTFRYWIMKQLGLVPSGYRHVPLSVQGEDIVAAAFCDESGSEWVVQLFNSGASREITLTGLPDNVTSMVPVVSGFNTPSHLRKSLTVEKGEVTLEADSCSLVTLVYRHEPMLLLP